MQPENPSLWVRQQQDFAQDLFNEKDLSPALAKALTTRAGVSLEEAFAIYRNNVLSSLVRALQARFPVTQTLLGEDAFRLLARDYALAFPPDNPVMGWYGRRFPDFLAQVPDMVEYPYLPAMAAFENARIDSATARDAPCLTLEDLAQIPSERLETLVLRGHPAAQRVASDYPILTLWEAHQVPLEEGHASGVFSGAEAILITRPSLSVCHTRLDANTNLFLEATCRGESLALAASHIPPEALAPVLASLITRGAFEADHTEMR
jgi:hypothetical protein